MHTFRSFLYDLINVHIPCKVVGDLTLSNLRFQHILALDYLLLEVCMVKTVAHSTVSPQMFK